MELHRLQSIYGSLSSPKLLPSPLSKIETLLVDGLLLDPHFKAFPPALSYQQTWWKYILSNIENEDKEADERIYEHYTDLISQESALFRLQCENPAYLPGPPAASFSSHFYVPSYLSSKHRSSSSSNKNVRSITLLEARTTIEAGTTGLRTWKASFLLGEWLLAHPEEVVGQRVLELGSGIGFLGILIAHIQRDAPNTSEVDTTRQRGSICLTDVNDSVIERCKDNVQLDPNGLSDTFDTRAITLQKLDWTDTISPDAGIRAITSDQIQRVTSSVIVGADIVYDLSLIPALVETLCVGLKPQLDDSTAKRAWIALSVRREHTFEEFLRVARSQNLQVEEQSWDLPKERVFVGGWEGGSEDEGASLVDIKLLKITVC